MDVHLFDDPVSLGRAAADRAAVVLADVLDARGAARIIAATGNSQIHFLNALVARRV